MRICTAQIVVKIETQEEAQRIKDNYGFEGSVEEMLTEGEVVVAFTRQDPTDDEYLELLKFLLPMGATVMIQEQEVQADEEVKA